MKRATVQVLRDAFGRECAAHMRYLIFSEKAAVERFPGVARLFRALAASEKVHASRHYELTSRLLGEYRVDFTAPFILERTVDHLTKAWEACRDEGEETYLAFAAVAREQNELHAAKELERTACVKRSHAGLLRTALGFIEHAAEDPGIDDLSICGVCGLVAEGKPPENCPACEAKSSSFTPAE